MNKARNVKSRSVLKMPTRTKRLTEFLFRRSSNAKGKQCRSGGNLMSPLPCTMSSDREHVHDYEKEDDSEEENAPLVPISIPELIESSEDARVSFGKVVVFAEKLPKCRQQRARSSSPSLRSSKVPPHGILKNSCRQRKEIEEIARNFELMVRKPAVQRTKSYPSKLIPVSAPCLPKESNEDCKNNDESRNSGEQYHPNPLLNLAWNYPTIEKKRDAILNYFRNLNNKAQAKELVDQYKNEAPIYEEIPDKNEDRGSPKPKLSPKKVRLNLPPLYDNLGQHLYMSPTNHGTITRSSSFGVISALQKNNKKKMTPETAAISSSIAADLNKSGNDCPGRVQGLALADFAAQVAEHAKHKRAGLFRSTSCRTEVEHNSQATTCPPGRQRHEYDTPEETEALCDMDKIYYKLDKRPRRERSTANQILRLLNKPNNLEIQLNHEVINNDLSSYNNRNLNTHSENVGELNRNMYANLNESSSSSENEVASYAKSNTVKLELISSAKNQHFKGVKILTSKESEEMESGISTLVSDAEDVNSNNIKKYVGCRRTKNISEDSCCHSATSSSAEEESESRQKRFKQHLPPSPSRSSQALTKSTNSNCNSTSSQIPFRKEEGVEVITSENFITQVRLEERKGCNEVVDRNTTNEENGKSVLTISVIDSTESNPKSEREHRISAIPSSVLPLFNEAWYQSLKKGTVHLDPSVTVIHQTPKNKGNNINKSNHPSKQKQLLSESRTDCHEFGCGDTETKTANHKSKRKYYFHQHKEDVFKMSASTLLTSPPSTVMQDGGGHLTSGLLIEAQNLWDNSSSESFSPPSSQSSSGREELSSSSSSASDTSEISVQLAQMSEPVVEEEFIPTQHKYEENIEDDGGFESFQVLESNEDESVERFDDSQSDENEEAKQPLGISGTPTDRQRTFAQLTQGVPEQELMQKANTVLDLINAEISDLHTRELELKKKNRGGAGKQQDNDSSEDLIETEGSSQADSEEYSDSAVDVESYSRNSGSSGNVTPADKNKVQHDPSTSPQPLLKEGGEQTKDDALAPSENGHVEEDEALTSATPASALLITADEADVSSRGTVTSPKQQGMKVRPIVEEEVKSIQLSLEKETPIEREIRLVREREEDFRRQRMMLTMNMNDASAGFINYDNIQEIASPLAESNEILSPSSPQDIDNVQSDAPAITKAPTVHVPLRRSISNSLGSDKLSTNGPKDLQYAMATARLRREIEENIQRERELFREGRLKTLNVPESETPSSEGSVVQSEPDSVPTTPSVLEEEVSEQTDVAPPSFPIGIRRVLVRLPSSPANVQSSSESVSHHITSPVPQSAPVVNSMRFFAPSGFTPVSRSNSTGQSSALPFGKLTSIEKMILNSTNLSFSKRSSPQELWRSKEEHVSKILVQPTPDPLQIVQRTNSSGDEEEREMEKPIRKYIPAQDKIQKELQEQMKREKELSQLRSKWKSTPDLSAEERHTEEENTVENQQKNNAEDEGLRKPSTLRRQMSASTYNVNENNLTTSEVLRMNKPTIRRRHSALINQWEEIIKQQQERNKY